MFSDFQYRFCWQYTLLSQSFLLSLLAVVWITSKKLMLKTLKLKLLYIIKRWLKKKVLNPTCSEGDPGSIPGSGRYPREGVGYPFQCSWASLVVQLVKNSPTMWEIWVQSLGWEDPLEKGKATHSSILAWRNPWIVHGVTKSWTKLNNFHFLSNPENKLLRLLPRYLILSLC